MARKVFCISMQRSGTSSVGDWLQAHGLQRAGWPVSDRNQWTHRWAEGNYEAIFETEDFKATQIFEDDPWWCPYFYRELAERFPSAAFVLLERPSDAWFRSLCLHSGGRNPGHTDIHCAIYGREDELTALRESGADVGSYSLLDISAHEQHYTQHYLRHNRDAISYFQDKPNRLFHGSLYDPTVFERMLDFLDIRRLPEVPLPHANASSDTMRDRLDLYLAARA